MYVSACLLKMPWEILTYQWCQHLHPQFHTWSCTAQPQSHLLEPCCSETGLVSLCLRNVSHHKTSEQKHLNYWLTFIPNISNKLEGENNNHSCRSLQCLPQNEKGKQTLGTTTWVEPLGHTQDPQGRSRHLCALAVTYSKWPGWRLIMGWMVDD